MAWMTISEVAKKIDKASPRTIRRYWEDFNSYLRWSTSSGTLKIHNDSIPTLVKIRKLYNAGRTKQEVAGKLQAEDQIIVQVDEKEEKEEKEEQVEARVTGHDTGTRLSDQGFYQEIIAQMAQRFKAIEEQYERHAEQNALFMKALIERDAQREEQHRQMEKEYRQRERLRDERELEKDKERHEQTKAFMDLTKQFMEKLVPPIPEKVEGVLIEEKGSKVTSLPPRSHSSMHKKNSWKGRLKERVKKWLSS